MSATWEIRQGDCVEQMAAMPDCSIDAVVCDPPYGIGFMGHDWDQPGEHAAVATAGGAVEKQAGKRRRNHPNTTISFGGPPHPAMQAGLYDLSPTANRRFQAWCEAWAREALRVLKPGGHMLVCGGTRTYHRMAAGIEDAGFEIRDCLVWLYGSGFPKSLNLDGPWEGWGTALKPAHEPIVVARKPLAGTVAQNVAAFGTGVLNIDGCRIGPGHADGAGRDGEASAEARYADRGAVAFAATPGPRGGDPSGRWPANVLLDEEAAAMLDEQTGELTSNSGEPFHRNTDKTRHTYGRFEGTREEQGYGDSGGASRFFYCAKASRAERGQANSHPTVKPVALMRWLVRLVCPPGGLVLDPFTGSGTTGIAATREGMGFIGLERDASYVDIARRRIRDDQPMFNVPGEVAA